LIEFRKGTWFVDGEGRNDLEKCSDVDLEASPCTNTPPIRRSRLKIGQRIDLTAAWVRLPSLKVMPLKQSYERRNAWKYLYRSDTGFDAELAVDDFGIVTRYGNIWKEVV
jgi:hypothetical protein